jgi:ligand-binding sensor domain-containing protein
MRTMVLGTLIVALWLDPLLAQTLPETANAGSYAIDTWRTREGLPQDTVRTVLQTRDGYPWLGTEEGLVRFDGVRSTVFDKGRERAFQGNDVQVLLESSEGGRWLGTASPRDEVTVHGDAYAGRFDQIVDAFEPAPVTPTCSAGGRGASAGRRA